MEENKNIELEQIISQKQPIEVKEPQIKNMEVHHHGHVHEKKKWKEYVFQFFMLFLAVFCGFLAEYQLEHSIERHREKEYIRSMIADLSTDTMNIRISIERNNKVIAGSDSLLSILDEGNFTKNTREMYFLASRYSRNHHPVSFTKRTMSQLKNAGGLRLIRSKAASDSIIEYDVLTESSEGQAQAMTEFTRKSELFYQQIFDSKNIRLFSKERSIDSSLEFRKMSSPISLLTREPLVLKRYANSISARKEVANGYVFVLKRLSKYAPSLINVLKKEYDLENE